MPLPVVLLGRTKPGWQQDLPHLWSGHSPTMLRWTITKDGKVFLRGIAHFPVRGEFRVLSAVGHSLPVHQINWAIEDGRIPWNAVEVCPELLGSGEGDYKIHIAPL